MAINKSLQKKEWKTLEVAVEIPQGITFSYENAIAKAVGPKGEVQKKLRYPRVYINVEGSNVLIGTKHFTMREKKIIHTFRAHVKNIIKGVMEGFEYNLVVVYAKFPMTVSLSGNKFEVKNLLGEKVPRTYIVPDGVKVEVKGSDIKVSSVDKEKAGQTAASIEQLTKVTNLDRRVVQDGIFITKKPHRSYI